MRSELISPSTAHRRAASALNFSRHPWRLHTPEPVTPNPGPPPPEMPPPPAPEPGMPPITDPIPPSVGEPVKEPGEAPPAVS